MTLCAALERDHRGLLQLLNRAARTSARSPAARSLLLARAHAAFEACASTEEGQLYPALRGQDLDGRPVRSRRLVDSVEELAVARRMFDELRDVDPGDPRWIAHLVPLTQHVERRTVQDQRELFPLAKRLLGQPASTRDPRRSIGKNSDDTTSLWV